WRFVHQTLYADDNNSGRLQVVSVEESKSKYYPSLTIVVGTTLDQVTSQLRMLALALIALSTFIWLSAAFFWRLLCRSALSPLTRMTISVKTISADDLNKRLPTVTTRDELEGLSCAFNELLDRLQISFERQRRFAAEASHQLRTPLTAMLGQLDVAMRRNRS